MRNSDRLSPRPAFLDASRRVKLFFETGSVAKFAQAHFVFDRLGLPLSGSHSDDANVIEDYVGGVQQLIEQKLRDVSLGQQTLYFVEDTYVRIEALSKPTDAIPHSVEWTQATFPGLMTKEWFESVSFLDLDSLLESQGGNRRASVYSTVGLHIPGIASPQIFSGCTDGLIAKRQGTGLEENQGFPWLDPHSFNSWFIPEGENVPLSDLDLHRSLNVDFRVTALLSLAERLEEYVAILNLPSVSVETVSHKLKDEQQPQLFPTRRPPIAVIGLTCAGKTTLGQFLGNYGYEHIEASSVLQILQGSERPPNSRPGYFQAITTLSLHGWDIIARRAVDLYKRFIESGFCITGLRTVEELNYLVHAFPDLIVVHIEAPERTRFERYMRRDRVGDDASLTRFREREQEHASFGLIGIADHCATIRVTNNSTLSELDALANLLAQNGSAISSPGATRRGVGEEAALRSQIYRCALVLARSDIALSPADIELLQGEDNEARIVKRNAVRKTLAEHPVLVRRVRESEKTTFYSLTDHGHSYVSLIRALGSARSYEDGKSDNDVKTVPLFHKHSK